MQVNKKELERQQLILKSLGFYNGRIDGVWGPLCIEGKKKFEAEPSFVPGIPTNGLPFAAKGPYPSGMAIDRDNILYHPVIEKHLVSASEVAKNVSTPKPAEVKPQQAAPVVDNSKK